MSRRAAVLAAVALAALTTPALAEPTPDSMPPLGIWDNDKAAWAVESLLVQLAAREAEAIKVLEDDAAIAKRPKSVYYAIQYLQGVRSVKAVPVLCDRLLYEQKVHFYDSPVDGELHYPCVGALIVVGLPSVDGLLTKLGSAETNDEYRRVAFGVLEAVVGKDKVVEAINTFQEKVRKAHRSIDSRDYQNYREVRESRLLSLKADFKRRWADDK